ncbi:MAG: hypothetical protein ABIS01_10610, partial [Ferruginibacter sp.]
MRLTLHRMAIIEDDDTIRDHLAGKVQLHIHVQELGVFKKPKMPWRHLPLNPIPSPCLMYSCRA